MKLKQNENWPSVILHNGRPYLLKKLTRKGVNDPCSMCDLRQQCITAKNPQVFYELCTSDGRGDGWYYEEDWTIFDKPLSDFLNPELANDFLDK